jgi:hypothetical protein
MTTLTVSQPTFPVQTPGAMTLTLAPVTAPRIPSPFGPAPSTFTPPPVSPEFQVGPQVAGYTSITSTTLKPYIPNVLSGPPTTYKPPQPVAIIRSPGQPSIQLPKFNTIMSPVTVRTPKRPTPLPQMAPGTVYAPTPGTPEYIISVLNEIDPDLFVEERIGKNKKGYSRDALIAFANRLGLSPSGRNKPELIEAIQQLRREMGLV